MHPLAGGGHHDTRGPAHCSPLWPFFSRTAVDQASISVAFAVTLAVGGVRQAGCEAGRVMGADSVFREGAALSVVSARSPREFVALTVCFDRKRREG